MIEWFLTRVVETAWTYIIVEPYKKYFVSNDVKYKRWFRATKSWIGDHRPVLAKELRDVKQELRDVKQELRDVKQELSDVKQHKNAASIKKLFELSDQSRDILRWSMETHYDADKTSYCLWLLTYGPNPCLSMHEMNPEVLAKLEMAGIVRTFNNEFSIRSHEVKNLFKVESRLINVINFSSIDGKQTAILPEQFARPNTKTK
jgi:hypothetical protein